MNTPIQPQCTPDTERFWEATAAGELALCWCASCQTYLHPPLEACHLCNTPTEFRPVSGRGHLHSYIVVHRAVIPGYQDRPGHLIGLVELDEQDGLRLATQLLNVEADTVRIGMPMQARIVDLPGGEFRVPMFCPADQS
jgi:hypothetical protein